MDLRLRDIRFIVGDMALYTRTTSLTNYVEVAQAVGLDPYAQLAAAGVARRALLDPGGWLPAEQVAVLLENSAAQSGHPDFGLRMAATRQLSNLGPLAFVLRQEPTMRRALIATSHYLQLQNEAAAVQLEEENGIAVLRCAYTAGLNVPAPQASELIVGVLYRALRLLLGPAWQPRNVCFTHRAPARLDTHWQLFGRQLAFGQEFDGIVCASADLDRPPLGFDPGLAPFTRDYLDALLAQSQASMAGKVRLWVVGALPLGACTVENAARHFGIDRRTVHRQLAREGESFTGIVEAARRELVQRHLATPGRPLSQVASLLGFASQSAFAQWFRRSHGCSASQFLPISRGRPRK